MPIMKWEVLNKLLQEALLSYNDLVAAMNLVLFEDAMMHICRYLINLWCLRTVCRSHSSSSIITEKAQASPHPATAIKVELASRNVI